MRPAWWFALVLGDLLTLTLVTVVGFASHNELGVGLRRMLTTFLPLALAWLAIAPLAGLYDRQRLGAVRHLWRPFWAMALAVPFAAWLRAVWLNAPILPLFVAVLGGVSAVAMLAWRALFLSLRRWWLA